MSIYVLQGRERLGPFTLEEINSKLTRGELNADMLAWDEDGSESAPLGTLPGVSTSAVLPQPPRGLIKIGFPPPPQTNRTDSPDLPGAAPNHDSVDSTSATEAGAPPDFYEQLIAAFRANTDRLIEPFAIVRETVAAKKTVDTEKFFRLFLVHAASFNEDCASAFATVLRHSTQVDAVRATTVKQLARQIREEAFERCDEALATYDRTVRHILGEADAVVQQADQMDSRLSPTGGALLGSLIAGRGSRMAGAAAGDCLL